MTDHFGKDIRKLAERKMKARQSSTNPTWFGLSTFGMIGWAVVIPTVLFTFLGVWIDSEWPGRFSWTLMLLFLGVMLGCLNAWYWVQRENRP